MAKKKSKKGKGQPALKRQRSDVQHNRHRSYQAYVMQPSGAPSPASAISVSGHTSSNAGALGQGRQKGKGKSFLKGNRTGTQLSTSIGLSGQSTHKGKGSHSSFVKGKGTFSIKGKGDKEKGSRSPVTNPISHVYSANSVICMGTLNRIVVRNRHYKTLLPISKLVSNLFLANS